LPRAERDEEEGQKEEDNEDEPIPEISEPLHDDDKTQAEDASLRETLTPMKMGALRRRARQTGVAVEELDDAGDMDDPKGVIIELIIQATSLVDPGSLTIVPKLASEQQLGQLNQTEQHQLEPEAEAEPSHSLAPEPSWSQEPEPEPGQSFEPELEPAVTIIQDPSAMVSTIDDIFSRALVLEENASMSDYERANAYSKAKSLYEEVCGGHQQFRKFLSLTILGVK
jgi:hypothetical protein